MIYAKISKLKDSANYALQQMLLVTSKVRIGVSFLLMSAKDNYERQMLFCFYFSYFGFSNSQNLKDLACHPACSLRGAHGIEMKARHTKFDELF